MLTSTLWFGKTNVVRNPCSANNRRHVKSTCKATKTHEERRAQQLSERRSILHIDTFADRVVLRTTHPLRNESSGTEVGTQRARSPAVAWRIWRLQQQLTSGVFEKDDKKRKLSPFEVPPIRLLKVYCFLVRSHSKHLPVHVQVSVLHWMCCSACWIFVYSGYVKAKRNNLPPANCRSATVLPLCTVPGRCQHHFVRRITD